MRNLNRHFLLLFCIALSLNAQAYSLSTTALTNNKGNVGKTLDDMGKSENVHVLLTAMVTAGVLQGLNTQLGMQKINAQSGFGSQLQKNLIDNTASATLNHALNGGDFQQQLEQSLKSAFIDTGAAQSAYKIGDLNTNHDLNAFTHQLAHAIAGCAAGAAKSNDCGSGALGAAVGEMAAEWYGGSRSNASNLDIPALQTDTVNFARMISGIAAAVTGNDVNAAAGAGGNAAQNNYLDHNEADQKRKDIADCKARECSAEERSGIAKKYHDLSDKNNRNATNDMMAADGSIMPGYALEQEKASLTAMLTGPTPCSADPSCRIEVSRSISEINSMQSAPGAVQTFTHLQNEV